MLVCRPADVLPLLLALEHCLLFLATLCLACVQVGQYLRIGGRCSELSVGDALHIPFGLKIRFHLPLVAQLLPDVAIDFACDPQVSLLTAAFPWPRIGVVRPSWGIAFKLLGTRFATHFRRHGYLRRWLLACLSRLRGSVSTRPPAPTGAALGGAFVGPLAEVPVLPDLLDARCVSGLSLFTSCSGVDAEALRVTVRPIRMRPKLFLPSERRSLVHSSVKLALRSRASLIEPLGPPYVDGTALIGVLGKLVPGIIQLLRGSPHVRQIMVRHSFISDVSLKAAFGGNVRVERLRTLSGLRCVGCVACLPDRPPQLKDSDSDGEGLGE